jgi:hypothetical protein
LKGSKKSCDGKVPIYIRITIDGMAEDLSLGRHLSFRLVVQFGPYYS